MGHPCRSGLVGCGKIKLGGKRAVFPRIGLPAAGAGQRHVLGGGINPRANVLRAVFGLVFRHNAPALQNCTDSGTSP